MNENQYLDLVDATLLDIETRIENFDEDIDLEAGSGMLTVTLVNGSKIIINRQRPTQEIWVAARSGGYHCGWRDGQWICNTTQETLPALLTRVISEQEGGVIHFH